uniref:Uncharacterized protein n=1 Tax=Molossus molossus TaxID=27622 RepID=A0A7J8DCB3_MOLMO|nr:hypothetical protein HJG59_009399 [Molossus molossus]
MSAPLPAVSTDLQVPSTWHTSDPVPRSRQKPRALPVEPTLAPASARAKEDTRKHSPAPMFSLDDFSKGLRLSRRGPLICPHTPFYSPGALGGLWAQLCVCTHSSSSSTGLLTDLLPRPPDEVRSPGHGGRPWSEGASVSTHSSCLPLTLLPMLFPPGTVFSSLPWLRAYAPFRTQLIYPFLQEARPDLIRGSHSPLCPPCQQPARSVLYCTAGHVSVTSIATQCLGVQRKAGHR